MNAKQVRRIWRREGLKVSAKQSKRSRFWLNDGSCVRLRASWPSKLRDELLNLKVFCSLREAEVLIEKWRRRFNTVRPPRSFGKAPGLEHHDYAADAATRLASHSWSRLPTAASTAAFFKKHP